jgi:hypothetical protein
MKQVKKISFVIILPMICILQCGFSRGYYTTRDGNRVNGYIKFRECTNEPASGRAGTGIQFKASVPGRSKAVPFSDISGLVIEGKPFLVLESGKISGTGYHENVSILAELILDGPVRLLRFYTTKYQSTMFRTRRYDVEQFIAGKINDDRYDLLPQEPARFIQYAEEHFRDCPAVVQSIRSAVYTHPIKDPVPGNLSEYSLVESDQIIAFFRAYNSCSRSR